MSTEPVVLVNQNCETTCPGCNFNVVNRYRLDSESDDDAVCGDCFGEWLIATEAEVDIS